MIKLSKSTYVIVRNENYSKWLEKKKEEALKRKEFERRKLDEKSKVIEEKEYVKNNKLDEWFKKQATKLEQEAYIKKVKLQIERDEKQRIEDEKNKKKLESSLAYGNWLKKKEQEKKMTTKSSKAVTEKRRTPNELYTTSKDEENKTNNFKISIGPYSTGKALRNIEKKLTNEFQAYSYYEADEKDKKTSKKKIDDSLQDLSSIKKDTPVNENEGDDYE